MLHSYHSTRVIVAFFHNENFSRKELELFLCYLWCNYVIFSWTCVRNHSRCSINIQFATAIYEFCAFIEIIFFCVLLLQMKNAQFCMHTSGTRYTKTSIVGTAVRCKATVIVLDRRPSKMKIWTHSHSSLVLPFFPQTCSIFPIPTQCFVLFCSLARSRSVLPNIRTHAMHVHMKFRAFCLMCLKINMVSSLPQCT